MKRVDVPIVSMISIVLAIANCSVFGNLNERMANENNNSLSESVSSGEPHDFFGEYYQQLPMVNETEEPGEGPRLFQVCDELGYLGCCTSPYEIVAFGMICAEIQSEAARELLEMCRASLPSRRQIVRFTVRGLGFFGLC